MEILGTGSYGEVRKAKHLLTGEIRAIKIIYKRDYTSEEKEVILNEIRVMAILDHPNIVKLYEFFEDSSYFYLVMELCSGGELFDKLKEYS